MDLDVHILTLSSFTIILPLILERSLEILIFFTFLSKKNIFFFHFFLIVLFGVVGSIPGVGKVENWIIVGRTYLSLDKKDFVT